MVLLASLAYILIRVAPSLIRIVLNTLGLVLDQIKPRIYEFCVIFVFYFYFSKALIARSISCRVSGSGAHGRIPPSPRHQLVLDVQSG